MQRVRFTLLALPAPMLALAMVLAGCGGGDKDKGGTKSGDGSAPKDGGGTKVGGDKVAIEGKDRGTLKGKVVLDGEVPNMAAATADLVAKMKAKDETHCLAMNATPEEKSAFEWRVDPQSKGVANVFVWLAPPANSYFKLSEADKKPGQDQVVIDQPHCAFIPHCAVAFTCYNDGTSKLVPTGQKVVFKNSSGTAHNTNYRGTRTDGFNPLIQPGKDYVPTDITKPDQITLSCEIHTWMRAYIRNFDHPFTTVTDKDGNFEIKNVPTGVPVQLVYWHEKAEYGEGGAKGQAVTLNEGENTKELKVKAK